MILYSQKLRDETTLEGRQLEKTKILYRKGTECNVVTWVHSIQDMNQWRIFVYTLRNHRILLKLEELMTILSYQKRQ